MIKDDRDRKNSIGGSDGGAVLGLSEWASRFDVWLSKTGRAEDQYTETRWTYWGKVKEAAVAEHYARRHLVELSEYPKVYRPEANWFTGTPDRVLIAPQNLKDRPDLDYLGVVQDNITGKPLVRRGLEIKTGLAKHSRKWDPGGCVSISDAPPMLLENAEQALASVPPTYAWQCYHYMRLMGFAEWDLCVLLDSSDYREYRILYDEKFVNEKFKDLELFWKNNVEKDRPPPIDGGDMINTYLSGLYGNHTDTIRDSTELEDVHAKLLRDIGQEFKSQIDREKTLKETIAEAEHELHDLQQAMKKTKVRNAELVNWFRERIGPDLGINTKEGQITWKTEKKSRTLRKRWV